MKKILLFTISIIFIANIIPIEMNYDIYYCRATAIGVNFKLVKLAITSASSTNYSIILNSSVLCGLKPHFIFLSLIIFTMIICFIIDNYIFIILNILAFVFIKALITNFYIKHFKFSRFSVKQYIQYLCNNATQVFIFFIKFLIASLLVRTAVRSFVILLLNGNDSILTNILIILLSITIYYYILNIIIKLIKKEALIDDDFYLYNNYVIKKVNLYNITYIISINFMVKYFFLFYLIIISVLAVLIFIYFFVNIRAQARNQSVVALSLVAKRTSADEASSSSAPNGGVAGIRLKSIGSLVSLFIAFSVNLQESCNKGYIESVVEKKTAWDGDLPLKDQKMMPYGQTINVCLKKDCGLYRSQPMNANMEENLSKLTKSPILRMTYNQLNYKDKWGSGFNWEIKAKSFFYGKDVAGSILEVKNGNFLIINLVKHGHEGCTFMPSFYLHDGVNSDFDFMEKFDKNLLSIKQKLEIFLPSPSKAKGMVIFTQGEHMGYNGLFKVWRPSPGFMDPNSLGMTLKDYYHLEQSEKKQNELDEPLKAKDKVNRENKLSDQYASKKAVLSNVIKKKVWLNTFEKFKDCTFYNVKLKLFDPVLRTDYIFSSEAIADQAYRAILRKFFMLKDIEMQEGDPRQDMYLKELRSYTLDKYFVCDPPVKQYMRRDYSLDWSVWNPVLNRLCLVTVHKGGVIDGCGPTSTYLPFEDREKFNLDKFFTLRDNVNSKFWVHSFETRQAFIDSILKKPESFDSGARPQKLLDEIHGISINRLTFDMLSVKFNKDGGEFNKYDLYSYIDTKNTSNNHNYLGLGNVEMKVHICKQVFNFFDNSDEYTVRKFLDYIYVNEFFPFNSNLVQLSNQGDIV